METTPLISVIVPVYKVEKYLPKCVDSILNQTYENLEILLVDDGSPDSCGEICDRYGEKDKRVRVIHKKNGGLSSARNAGIDAAKGEYLGFVDSDDWIEPETYEEMLQMALGEQVKFVCAGRYDVSEETGEKTPGLCPQKSEVISAEEMIRRLFFFENCDSAAWDKLYHRSLFAGIRYPLGVHSEDTPTTYRLIEKAEKAAVLNKRVYNYLHRQNSITYSPVNSSTFDLEKHTETICPYISSQYPGLKNAARFLRVRGLRYSVLMVDLAPRDVREQYAEKIRFSRKELRKHFFYMLFCREMPTQEKVTNLLLSLNLYRGLRKLRHPRG